MAHLLAHGVGGEGVLLVCLQRVDELLDGLLVQEVAVAVGGEELVQVERVIHLLAVDTGALRQLVADNLRHLICAELDAWEAFVGIVSVLVVPGGFRFLLVCIGPVVDILVAEVAARQLVEGGAGHVERMLAVDFGKCFLGAESRDSLVGLIGDEQVDVFVGEPFMLIELAAELGAALEVLETHEHDVAELACLAALLVVGTADDVRDSLESRGVGNEGKTALDSDELVVVARPGVGDGGAVGDDEDLLVAVADDKVVCGEGLAVAGLGVEQELVAAVIEPATDFLDGLVLLAAERIVDCLVTCDCVELTVDEVGHVGVADVRRGCVEPFGAGAALDSCFS